MLCWSVYLPGLSERGGVIGGRSVPTVRPVPVVARVASRRGVVILSALVAAIPAGCPG